MKKNILMIVYFFPPLGEGGVQRIIKFLKFLNPDKYNIYVLAPEVKKTKWVKDSSLFQEIPSHVKIIRTKIVSLEKVIDFMRRYKLSFLFPFIYPDQWVSWLPFALWKGLRVIDKEKIDIVFTTSNPVTNFFVGVILKKVRSIKWIADFRDPWSLNTTSYIYLGKTRQKIDYFFEKKLLKLCDLIIANTPTNKKNLHDAFGLSDNKVRVISNGFDKDDFMSAEKIKPPLTDKYLNIVYTGTFYFNYNAKQFLDAIKDFVVRKERIKIYFIGISSEWAQQYLQEYDTTGKLSERINLISYVPHHVSISYMTSASLLLLVLPEGMTHWVPGKLYEYINSGVPILAHIPKNGDAANIIIETGTGFVVDNSQGREVLIEQLNSIYKDFVERKIHLQPHNDKIMEYSRKNLTTKLENCFDTLYS